MTRGDFNGVRDVFKDFVFNRSVNLQAIKKEKHIYNDKNVTFRPKINKSSNEIATGMMKKYWGPTKTKKTTIDLKNKSNENTALKKESENNLSFD